MNSSRIIHQYFPELSELQRQRIDRLGELYSEWNAKINVISRKDFEHFYERHVLYSLGLAKVMHFRKEDHILDVGTGGGFPGIPLAILFPDTSFHLVDSIGKKIMVVREVVHALGLANCTAEQARAEQLKTRYEFIISRAVTALPRFYGWTKGKIKKSEDEHRPNGIFYLKGGDFHEELNQLPLQHKPKVFALSDFFEGAFFETKKVVQIPEQ